MSSSAMTLVNKKSLISSNYTMAFQKSQMLLFVKTSTRSLKMLLAKPISPSWCKTSTNTALAKHYHSSLKAKTSSLPSVIQPVYSPLNVPFIVLTVAYQLMKLVAIKLIIQSKQLKCHLDDGPHCGPFFLLRI